MTTTYLKSLQHGLRDTMIQDERVVVLGEDILDPYGGAFKVTQGLSTAFSERVYTTPISEGGLTALATGMGLRGLRPVLEIMFGDFLTLCCDQLVNHATKFGTMYGQRLPLPLVLRTPMGGGRGYGATHSQSLEKMFLGVPGLKVVAPSHLHAAGHTLKHAILCEETPVLFIEHKQLYPLPLMTTTHASIQIEYIDDIPGYPTVVARNFYHGVPDVAIIGYGGMSRLLIPLLEALAEEEVWAVALLPSSLTPIPMATLAHYVSWAGRAMIVEEGTEGFNWGSELAARLYERLLKKLLSPIVRLSSKPAVIPASAHGEKDVLLQIETMEHAIMEVLA